MSFADRSESSVSNRRRSSSMAISVAVAASNHVRPMRVLYPCHPARSRYWPKVQYRPSRAPCKVTTAETMTDRSRLDGVRVLVVDDAPYVRDVVTDILEQDGAVV